MLPGLVLLLYFYNPNALLVSDCAPLHTPTVKAIVRYGKVICHKLLRYPKAYQDTEHCFHQELAFGVHALRTELYRKE